MSNSPFSVAINKEYTKPLRKEFTVYFTREDDILCKTTTTRVYLNNDYIDSHETVVLEKT